MSCYQGFEMQRMDFSERLLVASCICGLVVSGWEWWFCCPISHGDVVIGSVGGGAPGNAQGFAVWVVSIANPLEDGGYSMMMMMGVKVKLMKLDSMLNNNMMWA